MNLNQITIKSKNVTKSMCFYQSLGLSLIVDSAPHYVRLACPNGEGTFSISKSDRVQVSTTALYFEVADVDQIYQHLSKQGVDFESKPQDKRWLWREAELKDPDGHPLIIYAAGENRLNPPWRLKQRQAKQRSWVDVFSEASVNLMK